MRAMYGQTSEGGVKTGLIPGWRPRDRYEIVNWIGSLAISIACHALRHPLGREGAIAVRYKQIAYCPCTARRVN